MLSTLHSNSSQSIQDHLPLSEPPDSSTISSSGEGPRTSFGEIHTMTHGTILTDLPDELISDIFLYLALEKQSLMLPLCLTCKQFNRIAQALAAKHVIFDDNHLVEDNVRAFLQNPYTRGSTQRISAPERHTLNVISDYSYWLESGRHPAKLSDLEDEELEVLINWLDEAHPEVTFLDSWKEQLRNGIDDAIVALLILLARNLQVLELRIPSRGLREMIILQLIRHVHDTRLHSTRPPRLPLENLREIFLGGGDMDQRENSEFAPWAVVFHLPNLRIFRAQRIGISADDWWLEFSDEDMGRPSWTPFPHRTSSVEELYLDEWHGSIAGFRQLMTACKALRVLHNYTDGMDADGNGYDLARLSKDLLVHRSTLEEFVFQTRWPGLDLWDSESESEVEELTRKLKLDLTAFPKLRALKLLMYVLFYETGDYTAFDLAPHLPPSLENLLIGNANEKELQSIIAECRKDGRFERLHHITVSEDEGKFSEDERQRLYHELDRLNCTVRLEFIEEWQGLSQYIA